MTRRLERERRLVALLRRRHADAPERAVRIAALGVEEQDTAQDLIRIGLLRRSGDACYLDGGVLPAFRRKRVRLALTGAAGALGLALLVALLLLRH